MTKASALYAFFSGFGIPAYPTEAEVGAVLPYLVYEPNIGAYDDGDVDIVVNLWYPGRGETAINAKVQEISAALGMGGVYLPCDGGAVYLQRGTPFSQPQTDQADSNINGRYIQITAMYLTQD